MTQPAETNNIVVKKRPGRPKKNIPVALTPTIGITDRASCDEYVLELSYHNPVMFKKLLSLCNQYDASELDMQFEPTYFNIIANDHLNKSTIYIRVKGECMTGYYCREPVRVCITRENLELALSMISKANDKITFILKDNFRSLLYLIIDDGEYANENMYEVSVAFKSDNFAPINGYDDTNYPVKFSLKSKHFRNTVNAIRKLSQVLIIQKVGDDELQLTHAKSPQVNWISTYKDPNKISLQSSISPNDILSVSVNVDYIKPFTNSNIGEDIQVAADKLQRISFTTFLDKKDTTYACTVKIFTTINEYQNETPQ